MIEIVDLNKEFSGRGGLLARNPVQALRGVSLTVANGAAVSLMGESGSGKTTLGRILSGYESLTSGDILFDGVSISQMSKTQRREEFRKVQLIQQDPYAALNPARTLGNALFDPLKLQAKKLGKERKWIAERAAYLLNLVGLDSETTLDKHQHKLSGGQRQRLVIARALTVDPQVLIADEAVSMIDVSLRLDILNLLSNLRNELGISVIFITHDIASARYIADDGEICVLYRGEIVERGNTDEVIENPVHPYTQALLSAMPVLHGLEIPGSERFLIDEGGDTPTEGACLFSPRCPFANQRCLVEHPGLQPLESTSHEHSCFYPESRQVTPMKAL